MNILVAEDDPLSRVLLERILQRAGYDVIAVENGRQALEELSKPDPPRLALFDWVMPEKDGVEVCHQLRQMREQAYTFTILLSSGESKQDIVQGFEAGADDYLTKPFGAEELKARLRAGERILNLEDRLVEPRESMRFQATHDILTSLWNRGVIVELLSREVSRARREANSLAVDVRYRSFQNGERRIWPRRWRRCASRSLAPPASFGAFRRYGGPLRRRRISRSFEPMRSDQCRGACRKFACGNRRQAHLHAEQSHPGHDQRRSGT